MTRQLNLFATASQPLSIRDFQKEVVSELYAQIKTGTPNEFGVRSSEFGVNI